MTVIFISTANFNLIVVDEKVKVKLLNHVRLFVTPWTVAYQAPPSMGFSRQEYWSGLPFPFPGDLPDPGTEPGSPTLQAASEPPGKASNVIELYYVYVSFPSDANDRTSESCTQFLLNHHCLLFFKYKI